MFARKACLAVDMVRGPCWVEPVIVMKTTSATTARFIAVDSSSVTDMEYAMQMAAASAMTVTSVTGVNIGAQGRAPAVDMAPALPLVNVSVIRVTTVRPVPTCAAEMASAIVENVVVTPAILGNSATQNAATMALVSQVVAIATSHGVVNIVIPSLVLERMATALGMASATLLWVFVTVIPVTLVMIARYQTVLEPQTAMEGEPAVVHTIPRGVLIAMPDGWGPDVRWNASTVHRKKSTESSLATAPLAGQGRDVTLCAQDMESVIVVLVHVTPWKDGGVQSVRYQDVQVMVRIALDMVIVTQPSTNAPVFLVGQVSVATYRTARGNRIVLNEVFVTLPMNLQDVQNVK